MRGWTEKRKEKPHESVDAVSRISLKSFSFFLHLISCFSCTFFLSGMYSFRSESYVKITICLLAISLLEWRTQTAATTATVECHALSYNIQVSCCSLCGVFKCSSLAETRVTWGEGVSLRCHQITLSINLFLGTIMIYSLGFASHWHFWHAIPKLAI